MIAQDKLRAARKLSQDLLQAVYVAKLEYAVEMQCTLGCSIDDFDYKAFDDHLSDAVSDFNYEAMEKLRDAAREEESAAAFAEEMADRADYHARVA